MDSKEQHEITSLTPEELETIKKQLLDSIYQDIGRSVVKRFLWVLGAICSLLFLAVPHKEKLMDFLLH